MLVFVALLAAATAEDVNLRAFVEHAEERMRVVACVTERCRSKAADLPRYADGGRQRVTPDAKDRAFADDGSYCGVVGDKRCLSGRHAFFKTGESPVQTIVNSLPMLKVFASAE